MTPEEKGDTMFTKDELEKTVKVCDIKIKRTLNSDEGSDADYIHDLQTLLKLKDAAETTESV